MPVNSIISAKNIKKSYGKTEVLHDVSLDVKQGEVLAIMGKMEEEQVSKILPLFDSSRAARLTQSMMRPAKLE